MENERAAFTTGLSWKVGCFILIPLHIHQKTSPNLPFIHLCSHTTSKAARIKRLADGRKKPKLSKGLSCQGEFNLKLY